MAHSAMKIFAGNASRDIAAQVCEILDTSPSKAEVGRFSNGETRVSVLDSVRDCDVFLFQSGSRHGTSCNDLCLELFIMAAAFKTASAKSITAVVPYFPYSKQSKQKRRGCVPAKLVAQLIKTSGVNAIVTIDLHHVQMQGFFDVPLTNLKSSPLLIGAVKERIGTRKEVVIVAKNTGASKRAAVFAKRLEVDFALIFGDQTQFADLLSEEMLTADGSAAAALEESTILEHLLVDNEPPVEHAPSMPDEDSLGTSIIGSVADRLCVIVDDILDNLEPWIKAATLLQRERSGHVILVATHCLLTEEDAAKIRAFDFIDALVTTNSVNQDHLKPILGGKLTVVDIAPLLAEATRRIFFNESVSLIGKS